MSVIRQRPSLEAAKSLLEAAQLPTADLTEAHCEHFFYWGPAAAPTGLVGLELLGDVALLRSLVVSAGERSSGMGTALVNFAEAGKYEETIAALATICGVPVEVVDRLMGGDRYDPVLILARSAGFSWNTTRAIITTVPGAKGTSTQAIDAARENYERLTTTTAQRVVRFWQVRQEISEPVQG